MRGKALRVFFIMTVVSMLLPFRPLESAENNEKVPEGMVKIPAGWFKMGGDDKTAEFSGPSRKVYLDAFAIDKYEVTNAQYKKFVESLDEKRKPRFLPVCKAMEKGKPAPRIWSEDFKFPEEKADHPVVCVTWVQAAAYCRKNGKRLPTEAQWEKAARGTDGRTYPWGNKWEPGAANIGLGKSPWEDDSDGYARTAPVGGLPKDKSPYGVHDMAGNVWEWTVDFYWPEYHKKAPNRNPGRIRQKHGATIRPEFASVRGGNWALEKKYARTWQRSFRNRDHADDSGGFRCAADLK